MRFTGFQGEWSRMDFSEIGTFFKGKGISKEQLSAEGNPCILYGELYTKYKSSVINEVHSRTSLETNGLVKSKANDVIIPSSGESASEIATACCVNVDDVLLGGDLNIIRPHRDNGEFISYQLNEKRKHDIAKLAQGSSVTHLYNDSLKKLKLYFPNLDEQNKISNLITKLDEKISTQSKIIEELKFLKFYISENIFTQQLKLKDNRGNSFPDWKQVKLADISNIKMGVSPSSSSYNTKKIGLPLIQGNADILNRVTNPRNWTTEITKTCKKGDLILTVRAPVGAVAKSHHEACIGRGVCSISSTNGNSIEFIYQFLLNYEDKWGTIEQGSTFTAVSGDEIKKIKLEIPSSQEQLMIGNFLSTIDKKIEVETNQLELFQEQKKYLLLNLFI